MYESGEQRLRVMKTEALLSSVSNELGSWKQAHGSGYMGGGESATQELAKARATRSLGSTDSASRPQETSDARCANPTVRAIIGTPANGMLDPRSAESVDGGRAGSRGVQTSGGGTRAEVVSGPVEDADALRPAPGSRNR